MFVIKLLRLFKKSKCNHIVGIKHIKFGHNEVVYEDEFINHKCKFDGEILWKCPLCKKEIWVWINKYEPEFGHFQARQYVGYKR